MTLPIVAGTSSPIWIDLGKDEPGMTLQRFDREWVDYVVGGEVVISPVKIEKLPPGKYSTGVKGAARVTAPVWSIVY